MFLFVAAAAFALLLAPTRGEHAPAAKPLTATPAIAPRGGNEIADPWSRRGNEPEAASVLSRQAAELAADEVVDPWAVRPPPPPTPVTVLDVPVDPWANQGDFTPVATAPSNAKTAADPRDGLRDPWQTPNRHARRKGKASPAPQPPPSPSSSGEIADPWKGRSTRPQSSPATPHRPRILPPPQSSSRSRDGVVDPWH